MSSFDQFVAIDWSGARQAHTKAIAVATCSKSKKLELLQPEGHALWSRQLVYEYLLTLAQGNKRVLVGIDCNLGLPAPVVQKLVPHKPDGRELWAALNTLGLGAENFYGESVWTSPQLAPAYWQSGTMPKNWVALRRGCETACKEMGLGLPECTLKLIGSKQVGKGGLAGMLMLHALLQKTEQVAVWPFDPPERLSRAKVVICEIYPRLWLLRAGIRTKIRTQADMARTLEALGVATTHINIASDHDTDPLAAAAGLCIDASDYNLLKPVPDAAIRIEGWIHSVPVEGYA